MNRTGRGAIRACLGLCLVVAGCAGHSARTEGARTALDQANPKQALALLNDPTYVEAARALAQRALLEGGKDDKTRLIYAFRLATARKPSGKEVDVLRGLLDGRRDVFRKDRPSAVKLLGVGESQRDRRLDPAEHAAWTTVASVILNLDETITKQ